MSLIPFALRIIQFESSQHNKTSFDFNNRTSLLIFQKMLQQFNDRQLKKARKEDLDGLDFNGILQNITLSMP